MKARLTLTAGLVVAAGAAHAATVPTNAIGYSLGSNGKTLVTMNDLSMPSNFSTRSITDASGNGLSLSALAYRPQTGQLYGYSDQEDTVYLVDEMTGTATAQVSSPMATGVEALGFDFNNMADAARIVTTDDRNYVFAPNATPPTLTRVTDLAYAAGDANATDDPNIIANAYTNAVPNASTTLQFGIDSENDSLVNIANNAGTLTTVGQLYYNGSLLDVGTDGGMDILSFSEGDNQAFALFNTGQGTGLYSLSLFADADGRVNVDFIGSTGALLDGLAVAPQMSAVPVPAAALLLGSALGGLGVMRRRRARS